MKFYLLSFILIWKVARMSCFLNRLKPCIKRKDCAIFPQLFEEKEGFEDFFEIVEPVSSPISKSRSPGPLQTYSKLLLPILAVVVGVGYSSYQNMFSGGTNLALLHSMEKKSVPLQIALCNGKPTVIEFYADWCESCKDIAPSMRNVELKYKEQVNFIVLNGIKEENSDLVQKFKVDGIPHIAFLTKDAVVNTALVGAVPEEVLQQQISSLVKGEKLPYLGFDAFEGETEGKLRSACGLK